MMAFATEWRKGLMLRIVDPAFFLLMAAGFITIGLKSI